MYAYRVTTITGIFENIYCTKSTLEFDLSTHKGRSGRIAHLTFRRTKNILNTKESVRNYPTREDMLFVHSLKLLSPKKVSNSNSY